MKILFLTQRVPYPPNKGDKLRAYNIIKYLSKKHSVSLACLADSVKDLDYAFDLKKICISVDIVLLDTFWSKLRSLFCLLSTLPFTLAYFYSPKLKRIVNERLKKEKFDLIFIYSSSMAQYALGIPGVAKIMDFIDVDSDKWRQYADYSSFPQKIIYKMEEGRLRKYERIIARSVAHSFVTSKVEADLFKTFIPDIRVTVIANGVDQGFYKPNSGMAVDNQLVFMGQMDYFANVEGVLYFCREILPIIKEKIPTVKFYIVGGNPTKEITQLSSDSIIVTGYVEDVRPYVWNSSVCVIPLRIARGIQNKVLEAMAMCVPVVTTPEAVRGIAASRKEDLLIESDPKEFAGRVIDLLSDSALRRQLAVNACKTIEENYSWDKNLNKIDEIVNEIIQ